MGSVLENICFLMLYTYVLNVSRGTFGFFSVPPAEMLKKPKSKEATQFFVPKEPEKVELPVIKKKPPPPPKEPEVFLCRRCSEPFPSQFEADEHEKIHSQYSVFLFSFLVSILEENFPKYYCEFFELQNH